MLDPKWRPKMNCGCSCFCFKFWCTLEPRQHRSPPHARRVFLKPDPPENPYEKLKPRDLQPPPLPRKNSVYIELEHLSKGGCSSFGHSCFGGHGKRSDEEFPPPEFPTVEQEPEIRVPLDNYKQADIVPLLRQWLQLQSYRRMAESNSN